MSGSIFGLPLSQQLDTNGRLLSGALLYIYEAASTTPADTYADFGLSILNPWPLVADANARIPQFWMDDGAYRARLTTAAGVEVFDLPSVMALGPSTGEGGGGGDGVDPNAILKPGDPLWVPRSGSRAGFVRANARTIGSATSGATERANADTQPLYEYLWNTYSNSLCPVTGGRGDNAAADYGANKSIGVLDLRGRAPFGLDNMGNSAAGRLAGATFTSGDATTAASYGGAPQHQMSQAELPAVNLPSTSLAVSGTITSNAGSAWLRQGAATFYGGQTGGGALNTPADVARGNAVWNGSISGNVPLGGSGAAHNIMPPFVLGTWYLKL